MDHLFLICIFYLVPIHATIIHTSLQNLRIRKISVFCADSPFHRRIDGIKFLAGPAHPGVNVTGVRTQSFTPRRAPEGPGPVVTVGFTRASVADRRASCGTPSRPLIGRAG